MWLRVGKEFLQMKKRERNKNGNGGGGESDQGWIEEYENEAKKDERGTERGKWKRIVGGTNDMWWSNCISFKVHASPIKFEKQVSYQLIMISPSFIHSHFAYDIFSSIFFSYLCVPAMKCKFLFARRPPAYQQI